MSILSHNTAAWKKGRRVYPVVGNTLEQIKPQQQSNKDNHQESFYQDSVHQNLPLLPYEPVLHSPKQPTVNRNLDVSFLGNTPLVEDLDLFPVTPQIPTSASVTLSEYSQCDRKYQRCTLTSLPRSSYLLKKSKLPLSILIEPYARSDNEKRIPLVSNGVIARCQRCKSFINPFIQFTADDTKWKCNICDFHDNQVPPSYDWDPITRQKMDRWSIQELNYGCVDYVATSEFLARPPQPPVYLFVIDTSASAIETGMIQVLAESLIECIDQIPNNDGRTRVGFITVDQSIGFCSLNHTSRPEWMMVSDIDDIYLPRVPSDLLVNLTEAKPVVLELLERMKTMFSNYSFTNNSNCLGPALKAARLLLSSTGGKIVCFQASLPNVGVGALSTVQRKKYTITDENLLLEPASEFYRAFSEECVKSHVCADMFVFGSQNVDVATLNVIPRFTGGQTHYYPGFNAKNEGDKLKHEIQKLLKEHMGLEAIIRTKCSPGLVCKSFHGNFTLQAPDILVLPNVPKDGSYCIDLAIEGELPGDLAYIQTCMLYTSTFGERLIRVMTTCLPVVRDVSKVFYNADQFSLIRSMAHQAIDRAVTYKIRDAKEYLVQQTNGIFKAYSKEVVGIVPSKSQQLNLCRSLSMIPALVLSLIKSEAFNDRGAVPVNISTQSALLIRTLPSALWLRYAYPVFYSLHNMPIQSGTLDTEGKLTLPPRLNLSSKKLEHHGCYLLENGQRIFLWVGKLAVRQLCLDLFKVSNISELQQGQVTSLPVLDNPFSKRVNRIIEHIRSDLRYSNFYPSLYIVKEDDNSPLRNWFISHLLENQQQSVSGHPTKESLLPNSTMSYTQWLSFIKNSLS